ncbi:MAG TPA: histidine kinase [Chthoniobacterales bacterium]|jgi:signal transduction histidine kinase
MNAESAADLRQRLHDGLCQQLTAALMFSDALRRSLENRAAPELEDCERLVELLQSSADELVGVMNHLTEIRATAEAEK